MRNVARIAAAAAAFVLTACGGGGGGSQLPAATPAPLATAPAANLSGPTGKVSFTVLVPGGSTASATSRAPRYVSPSTASLTVSLQNPAALLATVNLTPGSPNCTTVATGTSCLVTASAPVGNDTLVVTTFDGANGTGHQLSSSTIAATIQQNATNTVALTLGGTAASTSVILGTTSVAAGAPATVSVTVVATDAAGNIIVGPGSYSTPIALANSDTTGVTTLSTTSVTAPGTNVTLTYNGNSLNGATITPSIGGTSGTAATLNATGYATAFYPVPSTDTEYIDVMAPGPGDGNVWYASYGIIGKMSTHGSATEFTSADGVPLIDIYALTAGSDGNMWFGDNNGDVASISPGGVITFATSATTVGGCGGQALSSARRPGLGSRRSRFANVPRHPAAQRRPQVINGGGPGNYACGTINSMVLGPDGNVWFSDSRGMVGNITPSGAMTEWNMSALLGWQTGSSSYPYQIAFGKDGNLYVADYNANAVDQIVMSGGTPTAANQLLLGCGLEALTTTSDGNVWFADSCYNLWTVPQAAFTTATPFAWSTAGTTNGNMLYYLLATPGGIWGTDDYYSTLRITGLTNVSATVSPAITPLFPFGNIEQYPDAICLGPDGNVWVSEDNYTPEVIAKVIYGAPGTGTASITRSLPAVTRRR